MKRKRKEEKKGREEKNAVGTLTIWFSEEAEKAWVPAHTGKRGRQRKYSTLAIEMALTLRELYSLTFRSAEGFVASFLSRLGLKLSAPDHSTLSRRSKGTEPLLRERAVSGDRHHLVVNGRGVSVYSELSSKPESGPGDLQGWKKLQLQVGEAGPVLPPQ